MGQKPPETSAERYRRRAEELRTIAKTATDAGVRREMLVLAQQYEKLAKDVTKIAPKG